MLQFLLTFNKEISSVDPSSEKIVLLPMMDTFRKCIFSYNSNYIFLMIYWLIFISHYWVVVLAMTNLIIFMKRA